MRFLEDHPSTKAVPGIEAVIGGKPWSCDGKTPMVNCDGIALSPTAITFTTGAHRA